MVRKILATVCLSFLGFFVGYLISGAMIGASTYDDLEKIILSSVLSGIFIMATTLICGTAVSIATEFNKKQTSKFHYDNKQ